MAALSLDMETDRIDMLKWVSERNSHIPMSELRYLVGIPPFDPDEEDDWGESDWS
jgi:hypothetical protein